MSDALAPFGASALLPCTSRSLGRGLLSVSHKALQLRTEIAAQDMASTNLAPQVDRRYTGLAGDLSRQTRRRAMSCSWDLFLTRVVTTPAFLGVLALGKINGSMDQCIALGARSMK